MYTLKITLVILISSFICTVTAGGLWCGGECALPTKPTNAWDNKCKTKFKKLGIYTNFSKPVAHVLHKITIEDFKYFFNIDLPPRNGIPTMNMNLEATDSEAVLQNLKSYPSDFHSFGLHAFDIVMSNIDNPRWDMTGNALERLLHSYHMQDLFTKIKPIAKKISGVTNEICACALDTKGNGIEKDLLKKFKYIQEHFNTPNYNAEFGIPELTDAASWDYWKNWKAFHRITDMQENAGLKRAAIYIRCAIEKFGGQPGFCKQTKQCKKWKGRCYRKGQKVPKNLKPRGWCDKRAGCMCYVKSKF